MSDSPYITSEFLAKNNDKIRFQLFRHGYGPSQGFSQNLDWRFPAEEPIVIEWDGDKTAAIVGSTCTVTLVVPYGAGVSELYTTNPREWYCEISRCPWQDWNNQHASFYTTFWRGWLDPEFYEEPFISNQDYEVTLTFSDFGMLKRLRVTEPGTDPAHLYTVQEYCYKAFGLIYPEFDSSRDISRYALSTRLPDNASVDCLDLKINLANFTDEDGETMTWYDVLEALLKPLALRIEQRAGRFYFYDLHSLTGNTVEFADTYKFVPIVVLMTVRRNLFNVVSKYCENDGTNIIVTADEISGNSVLQSMYNLAVSENRVSSGPRRATGYSSTPQYNDLSATRQVEWASVDQMLAIDKTYNNVKITFSPYAEAVLFDPEKEVQFETTEDFKPVKNGYDYDSDKEYDSFLLSVYNPSSTADETKGGLIVCGGTTMFKIKSLEGGNDCEGVIAFLADYNHDDTGFPELNERYYHLDYDGDVLYAGFRRPSQIQQAIASDGMTGQALYRTRRIMIPNAYGKSALAWTKAMLKIQIPMLYDQRYNPWEQVDDSHNEIRKHYGIKERANSIGLRLNIRLYKQQTGGSPIRYYQNIAWEDLSVNDEVVTMQSQITADCTLTAAGWLPVISGQSQVLPTLIMYNKFDGSKVDAEDSPCLGGMTDGGMPFNNNCETDHYFRKNNDGLYVPFPSIDTDSNDYQSYYWLEVEVTDGLYIYDQGHMQRGSTEHYYELPNIYLKNPVSSSDFGLAPYGDCRWWLVGFPTIKIVCNNNKVYEDVEQDDVESSGVINANAAEELSIDTICGSHDSPFANGAYIVNGNPVTTLRRGIRTASIEQLLIGTIYSQYAGRHIKLSGTAKAVLPLQGVYMLKDSHYGSKRFLVTSEVYNVIEGESEITMVEASADNYTSS